MVALPRTAPAGSGRDRTDQADLGKRRLATDQVGLGKRRLATERHAVRRRALAGNGRLVAALAAGVLLLAQCGLGDGDPAGEDGAAPTTSEVAAASAAAGPSDPAAAPSDQTAAAPSDPTAAPSDQTAAAPAEPAAQPPSAESADPLPPTAAEPVPATSGPPPVAVGTMPELRIDAGGYPHALFAEGFFSGPVDGYSAASSDTDVATAGVSPPDMLVVAPVSGGAASVTVTASGPGGSATQTFTVRVETGAEPGQVAAPPAPAPAPAPPPAAPEDPAPFVPQEELPVAAPPPASVPEEALPVDTQPIDTQPDDSQPDDSQPDDESLYVMATEQATAAPTLTGAIPTQTIIVGNSKTVSARAYFSGIVQGWAVKSSAPASVPVSVSTAGVVSFSANALGTFTITVTATNDVGSVRHGFTVAVKTASQVILTTVGDQPQLVVTLGRAISVDLSRYFSEAATSFEVAYDRADPNRLVDVTVQGSSATIQGLRAGTVNLTLVAASATARISRTATVQVTG